MALMIMIRMMRKTVTLALFLIFIQSLPNTFMHGSTVLSGVNMCGIFRMWSIARLSDIAAAGV